MEPSQPQGQPPQAENDPAARFRTGARAPKPDDAPPPQQPKPPRPQSLGRLLEETLIAPIRLGGLFDELAAEPPPGWGIMVVNQLVYWTAMLGLNVLHVAIVHPQALKYPPEILAGFGALSLALVLAGGFAAALAVEVVARAAGAADQNYTRSYQVVTLLSALAPIQAAVNWLPSAWPIPILLGAFACAVALERLRKAPALGSRVAVAALCAASLAAVSAARAFVERTLAPLAAAQESATQLRDMAAQLQQVQQASLPGAPGQPGAASSLSLLAPGAAPGSTPQLQQVSQSAATMMNSLAPMLNDPRVVKNMTPQQAEMMKQVNGLLGNLQGMLQNPAALADPKARAAQQAQLQQMISTLAQGQLNQPMPTGGTPEQQAQYQQMQKMLQQVMTAMPAGGSPPPQQASGQALPAGAQPQQAQPQQP